MGSKFMKCISTSHVYHWCAEAALLEAKIIAPMTTLQTINHPKLALNTLLANVV
jgi:hypothetical protein